MFLESYVKFIVCGFYYIAVWAKLHEDHFAAREEGTLLPSVWGDEPVVQALRVGTQGCHRLSHAHEHY